MSIANIHGTLDKARRLVAALNGVGVPTPDPVAAAFERADELKAKRPPLGEDVAAVLVDKGHAAALKVAQERAVADRLDKAYREAAEVIGNRALKALQRDADRITADELRPRALELIETLEKVAGNRRTLAALVTAGEHDLAQALARLEVTAADLSNLYTIRNDLYGARLKWAHEADVFNSAIWLNNPVVDGLVTPGMSASERWLAGIRAGGTLWFPTPSEAAENANQLAETHAELSEQFAGRARFRDQGSTKALDLMMPHLPRFRRDSDKSWQETFDVTALLRN